MAHRDQAWLGGLNYLANLLHAVREADEPEIEPVLITANDLPEELLARFPDVETIRTPLVDSRSGAYLLRKGVARALSRDVAMERLLRAHRIDLLSHSGALGRSAGLPTIAWIPDFQHVHLPDLIPFAVRRHLDRVFGRLSEQATTIVVSSEDARRDVERFRPDAVDRVEVLRFVAGLRGGAAVRTTPEDGSRPVMESTPFFHLPNQFWVHKNHQVVVDAVALLRERGLEPRVVCTGHTEDPRRPSHFAALKARIDRLGVASSIEITGVVPYAEVVRLMQGAVAVVNPSRFEGWSTTVEECKSMGLKVLLSDIAVHREQAPPRALYFDPDDPQRLAELLEQALSDHSSAEEQAAREQAAAALPARFREFGRAYCSIVRNTMRRFEERRQTRRRPSD